MARNLRWERDMDALLWVVLVSAYGVCTWIWVGPFGRQFSGRKHRAPQSQHMPGREPLRERVSKPRRLMSS